MRCASLVLLCCLLSTTACVLPAWPPHDPDAAAVPEEPALRRLDVDRDGNDDWERASRLTLRVGQGAIVEGQLDEVDGQGVLDVVDLYRFTARAAGLELRAAGEVEVALVTADGGELRTASDGGLWLDDLSLDGSYGLRVTPRSPGAQAYALSLVAGAHVRASCDEGCRYGLYCVDGHCAQDGMGDEACMWDPDCRVGACVDGTCQDAEPACTGTGAPSASCRSCVDSGDCLQGFCSYGTCYGADGSCELATTHGGARCRGGALQTCSAGLWHQVGRCDTGCFGEACAPAPDACAVDGATLCMGATVLECGGGTWHDAWAGAASCPVARGLEGESCASDAGCQPPFACLPTALSSGAGVCALACGTIGEACADGSVCGADWNGRLFCLDLGRYGACDLSALQGCPGEVAGACLDGRCLTGCTVAACPGAGCACDSGQSCVSLDDTGEVARALGVCVRVVGPGATCDDTTLCEDGAVCLLPEEGAAQGQCYRTCHDSCGPGESCVAVHASLAVCVDTATVGQSCGMDSVCEPNAVCVAESSGAMSGVCRRLCTGESCSADETCTPLSDDTRACLPG